MKRLLLPLTIVTLVGLLWPLASPTAHACLCGSSRQDEVDGVELVVVASVTMVPPSQVPSEGNVLVDYEIDIERYLKGAGPDRMVLSELHQITGYDASGRLTEGPVGGCFRFGLRSERRRMLLLIYKDSDGQYGTGGCLRNTELRPVGEVEPEDAVFYSRGLAEFDAALGLPQGTIEGLANAPPSKDATGSSFPYVPAAVAATVGPLAFLAGAAFLWRPSRTSG